MSCRWGERSNSRSQKQVGFRTEKSKLHTELERLSHTIGKRNKGGALTGGDPESYYYPIGQRMRLLPTWERGRRGIASRTCLAAGAFA